jgi:N-acyl-D-aspartate/D-glutamate deacylase
MLYFLSRDVSIGSDGWAMSGDPAKVRTRPHPRSYGAIAEFFRLAREKRLCTVEEAVHRVTGKTAERFGLTDSGVLNMLLD